MGQSGGCNRDIDDIMSTNIIAFVIVLGVLIFFHELGHFLVARSFGVGVEKFSLGFGPRLIGKTVGRTDYRISAVPLGGYVKMIGEEPDAEIDPADIPVSFTHKSVWKRILIVAAGPFFNLLLAALIFFVIFLVSGVFVLKPVVGKVEAGSPAELAGIREGDRVVAIDNVPVKNWEDMAKRIGQSHGKTLVVAVVRQSGELQLEITPRRHAATDVFGEPIERWVIGISASGESFTRKLGLGQALVQSVAQTYRISELTVVSIAKLIRGSISTKTLGGPIMIAQMAGQQAKEGIANLVFFIGLLSINLAVINFLPIPVLDGGHLLFFFIEALTGKPLNMRMREIAQQVGIFVLLLLMIYVFYNDLTRIFFN